MTAQTDPYPLVAVLGPTASGKSELGLAIAERFRGEVVNFDSVQVYRGFDIGAAKLPPDQRRGIPHHALDIVDATEVFTAGDYARQARLTLAEIRERSRLPVLVGGTGFYLRALLDGLFRGPERDETLRRRLEQRSAERPAGYLHRVLLRLDAASARRIHPNDTPKLTRAIEVCLLGKRPMSELWGQGREPLQGFRVLRVGLDPGRERLLERIELRTARIFECGLIEETRRLLQSGVARSARPFSALGYCEALAHLDGKLSLAQAIELTARMTRRYAKRQMTWFRREPGVEWFRGFGDEPELQRQVVHWLGAQGA
ncbi:MAG: tRNA (adenosine(37)-N6)-dimethylallyltransferase MiaA [Bryobacterales bacterium]